jgi:hypothetical protein
MTSMRNPATPQTAIPCLTRTTTVTKSQPPEPKELPSVVAGPRSKCSDVWFYHKYCISILCWSAPPALFLKLYQYVSMIQKVLLLYSRIILRCSYLQNTLQYIFQLRMIVDIIACAFILYDIVLLKAVGFREGSSPSNTGGL